VRPAQRLRCVRKMITAVRPVKKRAPPYEERRPYLRPNKLDHGNIYCGRTFFALFNIKGHSVTFIE